MLWIKQIVAAFDRAGVKHFSSKLFVADYMNIDNPRLAIDRKQNLHELGHNIGYDHKRFKAELERAQEFGIQLIVLVEHGADIRSVEDIAGWTNPKIRQSPYAMTGQKLYKAMLTIARRYGVRWEFCSKAETGQRIIELLKEGSCNA